MKDFSLEAVDAFSTSRFCPACQLSISPIDVIHLTPIEADLVFDHLIHFVICGPFSNTGPILVMEFGITMTVVAK